uniref:Protein kinase domain-containing protein n=1 Tax=Percolomonas cosmopolitus TaxID=63605 RepID=A0A7S1PF67_9EUKA|mmetsp:Transcript_10388/g.38551  ORF Transcript_10388/g.38551 Transcript_10388/m.38551 type:complete len:1146 (+) Transcript_10388:550-3987(+)
MPRRPKRPFNVSKKKRDFLRREREKEQKLEDSTQPHDSPQQNTSAPPSTAVVHSTADGPSHHSTKSHNKGQKSRNHPQHVNKISLQWRPAPISSHSAMIPARQFHSCCLVNDHKMFCIGGDDGSTFFSDIWKYDTTTNEWTQVSESKRTGSADNSDTSAAPLPSSGASMRRTLSNSKITLRSSSQQQKCNLFSGRSGHSCVYYNNSLWVFGGRRFNTYLSDIMRFDLGTLTWHHIYLEKIVRARAAHTAVVFKGKMYAFGGVTVPKDIDQTTLEYLDSLLIFDFERMRWVKPETKGKSPRPRAGHSMTVGSDNTIYVWGGRNGSSIHTDFFSFNPTTRAWRQIEIQGKSPRARAGHTLNFIHGAQRQQILLYGGVDWQHYYSDLWLFDVEKAEWKKVFQTLADSTEDQNYSAPSGAYAVLNGRGWHTAVQCGTLLFLFGGSASGMALGELVVLDLSPLFDMNRTRTTTTISAEGLKPPVIEDPTPTNALIKEKNAESHHRAVRDHSETSFRKSKAMTQPLPNTHEESTQRFSGKIVWGNGEIRRIALSSNYDDLISIICKEYNFDDASQFSLFYTDEDDDKVTMRSRNDWEECLSYFNKRKKTVRLELSERSVGDSVSTHHSQLSSRTDTSLSTPTPTRTRPHLVNVFNNEPPNSQSQYATPSTPRTPYSPSRGRIQWQAGKKLGEGAYGKVYMAINLITKEYMAVKQVKVGTTPQSGRQTIESIMREINVMKGLEHPNIVRYLGVEHDDRKEVLNIFMELVHGGALATVAKQFTCFSENIVRHYTKQILLGLQYLHSKGIIHRDIKGANILISAEGEGVVKLADFGHSKQLSHHESMSWQSGGIKGTPLWMAPKVLRGEKQDQFSDIWSVGCVVLEMSTGKPPWNELLAEHKDKHVFALMQLIGKQKRPPKYPEHLSKEGKEFLDLCFGMETPVGELLRHPFVTDEYQGVTPLPVSSPIDENRPYSGPSSETWSHEDEDHASQHDNHSLQENDEFSNFNAMKSYNGLSDLDDSDDSSLGSSDSEQRETFSDESTQSSEEDVSDRILAVVIQDEESRLYLESLQKQVATVNQIMKSREQSEQMKMSSQGSENSQRTIALSQAQVLSCLKEQEEEIETGKKTVEKLGERTARVNARKMRKSRKFLE